MATMLTDTGVKKQGVPKGKPKVVWDRGAIGLGLKVTPKGARIWFLQLTFPGQKTQSRRTIGFYPALGVEDARAKAKHWYALAKSGIDPTVAEEEERREQEAAKLAEAKKQQNTFAAIAEDYIKGRKNRRAQKDAYEIRRLLVPEFGTTPIQQITARDVKKLIDRLKETAPYDARNAWSHAVGVFKYAVHEDKIAASPCASLDRGLLFRHAKIGPRQRLLNDDEVFALWRAADRLGFPTGTFVQLLILTGVRHTELRGARWTELHPELRQLIRKAQSGEHVDWDTVPAKFRLWTVPRDRFKSDIDHPVPLPVDAVRILASLPRVAKSDFIFTLNGTNEVWFDRNHKRRLDRRMLRTLRAMARKRGDDPATVQLERWTFHDTRRVVRTNLSALKVEEHVAEMCIGHTRGGTLKKIYDVHRYADEIREAMDKWAAKLRSIVKPTAAPEPIPANVITLASKQRKS